MRWNDILINFSRSCKIPAKKRTIQFRVNVTVQSTNEFNIGEWWLVCENLGFYNIGMRLIPEILRFGTLRPTWVHRVQRLLNLSIKSFVIWFCGHEGVQSSIAFLYFNLTDQNSSQNSLFRHNFSKPSASSQHKLQHRCFHLWYLPLFTTSLFYLLSGLHTCSHAV